MFSYDATPAAKSDRLLAGFVRSPPPAVPERSGRSPAALRPRSPGGAGARAFPQDRPLDSDEPKARGTSRGSALKSQSVCSPQMHINRIYRPRITRMNANDSTQSVSIGEIRGDIRGCSFAMGSIPRSWLRLGWAVAASVSEWKSIHSLTLAATAEMKRVEGNWHQGGSIKCPGACSGDLYCFRLAFSFSKLSRIVAEAGLSRTAISNCSTAASKRPVSA